MRLLNNKENLMKNKQHDVFIPFGGISQIDDLMLFGIH